MSNSVTPMCYDDFIERIGAFGWYQKQFFVFLVIPTVIFGGFGAFSLVFLASTPRPYMCKFPINLKQSYFESTNRTDYHAAFAPIEKTYGEDLPSGCKVYDFSHLNWTYHHSARNYSAPIECPDGYHYMNSIPESNIITDFSLVCGRMYTVSLIYLISSVGRTLGSVATAFVQDNMGRKITFFIGIALSVVFGACCAAAPNWQVFAALVFLKSLVASSFFNQPWILTIEMVGERYHALGMLGLCTSFFFGCGLLAGIVYVCNTWQQVTLVTNLPAFVFLAMWFFVDESPRWLLTKGRNSEAWKILAKMARVNGVKISQSEIENVYVKGMDKGSDEDEKGKTYGPWAPFSTWSLTMKTLILAWLWTVVFMIYFGLTINMENLGGNLLITLTLATLVEIPAAILVKFSDFVGRIWLTSITLFIGGLLSLLSAVLPDIGVVGVVTLAALTKLSITVAFDVIVLLAGEVYPTCIRGTGMAISNVIPSIFSFSTPYIVATASTDRMLPMKIFGIMALSAAVGTLFLNETLGQPLPDLLEDEKHQPVGWQAFKNNMTFKNVRHLGKVRKDKKHMRREKSKEWLEGQKFIEWPEEEA